ncbi:BZ3500_MvSof-1268-A1-R1_Chr11-2g03336 [Microbotryum saponariae]|uniref:BZ3500_MvSof-1268-A1-R1_Chr11-2g03336 protein n=1 Tax=Microbotryum saponariae TaxID=289078 RepID=A0A2X0N7C1_9BASI|nr:BZ3500_MvSof-1268-A1-R1_Chr11-2g03336 [Microbotryum saponariae]SDA03152.1 BZ3501_MvSof-1269-A2-R1_Chr11g02907 [Microbotryum saponariae]
MATASTSTSTANPNPDELDPATLFNFASLQLHVPRHAASPDGSSSSPPPATSASSIAPLGPEERKSVDEWVSQVAEGEERKCAYLVGRRRSREEALRLGAGDESLPFYLVIKLPRQPVLDRAQAAAFFLPCTSTSSPSGHLTLAPHLLLTADASFVEGCDPPTTTNASSTSRTQPRPSLRPETTVQDPKDDEDDDPHRPHLHPSASPANSTSIGLGIGQSPTTSIPSLQTASLSMLGGPKVPLTPSPLPTKREKDLGYVKEVESVPLWSCTFDTGGDQSEHERERFGVREAKGKRKQSGGRVWVGRLGGEQGDGPWMGVWEFRGDVAYVRSRLVAPRLCLTLNVAFRDDPGLGEMMRKLGRQGAAAGGVEHLDGEETYDPDEYLVESFEGARSLGPDQQ